VGRFAVQTGAVPRSDHRYLASTFFHEADHSSAGTPGCNYGPGSTTTSQPHRAYCLFRHLTRPLPDGLARLPERALTTCIRLARAFAPCGYLTAVPRTLLSFHRVTCLAPPNPGRGLDPEYSGASTNTAKPMAPPGVELWPKLCKSDRG
jgi:hypothetical protein